MHFLDTFLSIRLDIVGFTAILGEGSVERNVQTLGAAWHSKLPRLMPAPQALMKHERAGRLPTSSGTVVGAYSGNIRHDLNFFIRLMHPHGLEPFQVELCLVSRKELNEIPKGLQRKSRRRTFQDANAQEAGATNDGLVRKLSRGTASMLTRFTSNDFDITASYGPAGQGYLLGLSLVGFAMTIVLVVLSVVYNDGMSLLSVLLLSAVAMLLGYGHQWELDIPPVTVNRDTVDLPSSDVVIYYPNGSIRVIRCSEEISRLYFAVERCDYAWDDTPYRIMALISTVMLMFGLICLGNSYEILQITYAVAYILLNACYWLASALNPVKHYWETAFHSHTIPIQEPLKYDTFDVKVRRRNTFSARLHGDTRALFVHDGLVPHGHREETVPKRTFTRALWIAIALTGTSQWINHSTHIGPMTRAWAEWHARAESNAIKPTERDQHLSHGHVVLPDWDFGRELSKLLKDAKEKEGKINFKIAATAVMAAHRINKGSLGGAHGMHQANDLQGVHEEVQEVHEEVQDLHREMHGAGAVK